MSIKDLNHAGNKLLVKSAVYALGFLAVGGGCAYAGLEEQITKASELMLGKAAALLLGGAAVVGGTVQIKSGNILMGAAVLVVAAVTGIGVAMIKNQSIFTLLN